ncbi:unnamed protein product [Adineta ricciae]|uniref:Uncharacterized protein n=1 Tax=Adineta ricciae TaxID=249248 RepID=A0A815R435_ADIRI|nr:unnamed protein product [Adineta ricciae]CAF1594105.1 unnamed protein product [Adineta ricciae]
MTCNESDIESISDDDDEIYMNQLTGLVEGEIIHIQAVTVGGEGGSIEVIRSDHDESIEQNQHQQHVELNETPQNQIKRRKKRSAEAKTKYNRRHNQQRRTYRYNYPSRRLLHQPLKSEIHISDRLRLCDWLKGWTEEDFLHLAPSDEFYVWTVRKPNYENDRIWAKNVEDIEDDERYREMVKNQACIGICIIFTAKKMHRVIKDKGESWTGEYFRGIILMQHVFSFLTDEENVIDLDNVIFVPDKARCMRANMTQHLIRDNNIEFWGNDIWPGNSPDLNTVEHIGSIIKDEVEQKMLSKTGHNR